MTQRFLESFKKKIDEKSSDKKLCRELIDVLIPSEVLNENKGASLLKNDKRCHAIAGTYQRKIKISRD